MTKAKKQSLILVIAIVLVMFFIASIIGMSTSQNKVLADSSDISMGTGEEGAIQIGDLMINGNVGSNYKPSGIAINNIDELKQFIKGEGQYAGTNITGYLTADINDFSWDGAFTNLLMAESRTLDGAGHKITMTANTLNTSPWVSINSSTDFRNTLKNTFFCESSYGGDGFTDAGHVDLNGGFVGYIPSNCVIKNVNFVYDGQVSGSYSSDESGTGGIVAAISAGTIDNCSLTVNGYFDVTTTGMYGDVWGGYREMASHSYAIGGYAGMMSGSNAIVSNSKITLSGNSFVNSYINGVSGITNKNTNISAVRHANRSKSNIRLWGGGVVGWMANSSQVYNIATAGSGNIAAFTGTNGTNPLSYTGIVAGSCATAKNGEKSSVVGNTGGPGSIDGVINSWTGRAIYYVQDTSFSPIGTSSNEIASQICGLSGNKVNGGDTVSNIYFMYNQAAIDKSSVTGYNFSTGACNMPVTYIYVMDYDDNTDSYYNVNGTAKANNAYLTYSNTTKTANVLAVYDTDLDQNPGAILWQIDVDLNTSDSTAGQVQNFYEKISTIKEADKYAVTYTEINRTHTTPVEIKYQLGKIIYYTMNFDNCSIKDNSNNKNIILNDKEYDGQIVNIPNIEVRDYNTKAVIDTILASSPEASSYWVAKKANDMNLYKLSDTKNVGEYEYFIYNGDPNSNIDALDTTNRYVAYRKDNPEYPQDGSGATGTGATAWQPRVSQTVVPKSLIINLNAPSDFVQNTQYDGEGVLYTASFGAGIVSGDSVSANLGYYDATTNEKLDNNSAVNAGSYYVKVDGLDNLNYTFSETKKDFTITKREVNIEDNTGAVIKVSYELQKEYTGLDQSLTYGIYDAAPAEKTENIIITNVLEKDKGIINVAHSGDTVNVGEFTVDVTLNSGLASQNYVLGDNVNYKVTITPAKVKITLGEAKTITYGQIDDPTVTVEGVNGEVPYGEWLYMLKDNVAAIGDYSQYISGIPDTAGIYSMVYYVGGTFGVNKNYEETYSEEYTYTINKRNVTIFFDEGLPTEYDYNGNAVNVAATFETQNTETNTGILNIHASRITLKYTFSNNGGEPIEQAIDAGSYTVNAVLEAGFDTSSYNIIYPNEGFEFVINPMTIDITIDNAQKTYGSLDPQFVWNYSGEANFLERDNVVLTLSTEAGQFGNVGNYTIAYNITEGKGSNYVINANGATLEVLPYEVNIKTTTSKEVLTYGDEAPVLGYEFVGENKFFEEDGLTINAVADKEIKNAGVYTVSVEGYTDNYTVNIKSATFEILPKDISILSAEIVGGDTFTYTGSVITPEVNAVFEDGVLIGDDTVEVAFDYFQNGEKVEAVNVGTYDAVISGVNNPNYKLVVGEGLELPSTSFTVVARKVNINVGDATREYGIEDLTPKAEAYTYNEGDQFVESDINDGRLVISLATDVELNAGANDYADSVYIVLSGEAATNYELTIAKKGTLTVTGANISSIQLLNDKVVYNGQNLIDTIKFNVAEGITGYGYKVTSDAEGQNEISEIINAGTYYITVFVDGESMFEGEPNTLTFVVDKANRVLTVDDINKIINYNKLTFECAFENMQYSVNGEAYLNTNVFDAKALTSYTVKAKAGESANYYESNEVEFEVKTGIDTTSIVSALNKMNKVDFSNLAAYKTLLSQLELVGESDKANIDYDKVNALKASYEELLSGAESVIGDAQKVAGKASGMTAKGAVSLALTTGVGLAFAGVMLSISAKKGKKEEKRVSKVNRKSIAKAMTMILVIVLICAVAFAGCKKDEFSQDSLFKLASYTTDSKEKDRDVKIVVNSGSTQIYKYENGEETFLEGLENSGSFSLAGKGTGFTFQADMFENAEFTNKDGVATFKANVKDTNKFLGVSNAKNAKVEVKADSANNKLKSIQVSYDVEQNGISYSIQINVDMKY